MSFGPNSTNARERRAYAHAKIAAAKESGELRDLWAAQMAVVATGDFRKSVGSNFRKAIESAAMSDEATRTIVERVRDLNDPELSPRGRVRMDGLEIEYAGRLSSDFSAGFHGIYMHRSHAVSDRPAGHEPVTISLHDHGAHGYPAPHIVPTDAEGEPEVWQIRHIPDGARMALASMASEAMIPRFPGDPVRI